MRRERQIKSIKRELLRLTSLYGCCLLISCGWGLHFIEANSALWENSRYGGGGGVEG